MGLAGLSAHLSLDAETDAVGGLSGQLDALVEHLNASLDAFHPDQALRAVHLVVVPLRTHEVVVGDATPADVAGEDQSLAALAAEDCATQVVGVDAVLLSSVSVGGENVLHTKPDVGLDERRVLAFVGDALVADDAHVVRVAQHVQQRGQG
ncbi:hypothetical protein WIS52_15010 [Pseudonocardia nematodicida]|uniref:Uncharacterized protein n=1 Tax=Pseudonocardia nematodicida TaxID=1206997 RepID=A0ABV1KDS6_9PSEU